VTWLCQDCDTQFFFKWQQHEVSTFNLDFQDEQSSTKSLYVVAGREVLITRHTLLPLPEKATFGFITQVYSTLYTVYTKVSICFVCN
jgi:hypothetical protein